MKKALDPNTLLSCEMNGDALPVKHGLPLRVVAPGWASDSWVKWLTSMRVLDKEFDGFSMKGAYRRPGPFRRGQRFRSTSIVERVREDIRGPFT